MSKHKQTYQSTGVENLRTKQDHTVFIQTHMDEQFYPNMWHNRTKNCKLSITSVVAFTQNWLQKKQIYVKSPRRAHRTPNSDNNVFTKFKKQYSWKETICIDIKSSADMVQTHKNPKDSQHKLIHVDIAQHFWTNTGADKIHCKTHIIANYAHMPSARIEATINRVQTHSLQSSHRTAHNQKSKLWH